MKSPFEDPRDPSPWQRGQLDREYVERWERLKADHRDRDERRASELETERSIRVKRYVMLSLLSLTVLASILLFFLALHTNEVWVWFTPSAPVTLTVIVGRQLSAIRRSDRAESQSPGSGLRPTGSRL